MNGFGLLLAELHKKERSACAKRSNLAGAVRFELTTKVLETHVLPLHHAPMFSRTKLIIQETSAFVNTQVSNLPLLFAEIVSTRFV